MDSKPILYLKDASAKTITNKNIDISKKNIRRFLNIEVICNKNRYKGELMMIDRKGNVKIFDIENSCIYSIIKCSKDYRELHKINQHMKDIYNLTFTNFDDKNKVVTEDYIDFKNRGQWSTVEFNSAVKEVCSNTKKNLIKKNSKNFQSTKKLIQSFNDRTMHENKEYSKLVIDLMPSGTEDEFFSIVRNHGDMNFNNFLLKDNVFYAIDWYESIHTVFFYDFFSIIFVDWKWRLEPYFMKKYFDGAYDELLTDMFMHSSTPYDKNKKNKYLSIYLMNRHLMFEDSSVHKLNERTISMTIRALKNFNSL